MLRRTHTATRSELEDTRKHHAELSSSYVQGVGATASPSFVTLACLWLVALCRYGGLLQLVDKLKREAQQLAASLQQTTAAHEQSQAELQVTLACLLLCLVKTVCFIHDRSTRTGAAWHRRQRPKWRARRLSCKPWIGASRDSRCVCNSDDTIYGCAPPAALPHPLALHLTQRSEQALRAQLDEARREAQVGVGAAQQRVAALEQQLQGARCAVMSCFTWCLCHHTTRSGTHTHTHTQTGVRRTAGEA